MRRFIWLWAECGFFRDDYLFKQCKDYGGTPVLKKVGQEGVLTAIIGINCLMPDGSIKDIYGEKFEKDTGKKLSQ